ncbi:hypothetical protein BOTBODRAFT_578793 [Botryobasidium botryosum FD-172 SS1]|uniref:Uncharacterized protein n=1 Tax=Botryobasidium botryosum (strain FD-172 SS1) TaxID=930990 RepID=A0A067MSC5_BOTB1|nr:hypothetical protein BOTBODRAFT_578793 [Botryobasidium botryosum FD-172 SS1]
MGSDCFFRAVGKSVDAVAPRGSIAIALIPVGISVVLKYMARTRLGTNMYKHHTSCSPSQVRPLEILTFAVTIYLCLCLCLSNSSILGSTPVSISLILTCSRRTPSAWSRYKEPESFPWAYLWLF